MYIEIIERARIRKRRREQLRKVVPFAAVLFILLILILAGWKILSGRSDREKTSVIPLFGDVIFQASAGEGLSEQYGELLVNRIQDVLSGSVIQKKAYKVHQAENAVVLEDMIQPEQNLYSEHVVLVDLSDNSVIAKKGAFDRINPASMTKILTVLVAAESVEDLDDTFTITSEITDYGYIHDCSIAGFEKGETVTIRDLFYGTVLPSGADAAMGLAVYVAGSQEAFVEMMNQKLEILGLSETAHVTNCVGIYDKEHFCTVTDMAMILEAALKNELCREVLSAHIYTTSNTMQHPEGIELSNWFLRRIEDKDSGGEVLYGKTGYVVQSGNCAASYAVDESGKEYICVTTGAVNVWRCIEDHAGLYKRFFKEGGKEDANT